MCALQVYIDSHSGVYVDMSERRGCIIVVSTSASHAIVRGLMP